MKGLRILLLLPTLFPPQIIAQKKSQTMNKHSKFWFKFYIFAVSLLRKGCCILMANKKNNMKQLKIIALLLLPALVGFDCWGQLHKVSKMTLLCETEFDFDKDSVVAIIENSKTNHIARFFQNADRRDNRKMEILEAGILLEDGRRLLFGPKETVLDFRDDYITTIKKDWKANITYLMKYRISGEELQCLKSRRFEHTEVFFHSVKSNGNIVLSNDAPLFGSLFEFYDLNFNLLGHYLTYDKGFSQGAMSIAENRMIVVGNSNDAILFAVLDLKSGHIKKESVIPLNIHYDNYISQPTVYTSSQFTIIRRNVKSEGKLDFMLTIVNNDSGKTLWEKSINLPLHHKNIGVIVDEKENMLLAYANYPNETKWKILGWSLSDGALLWENDVINYYPFELLPNKYGHDMLRATTFQLSSDGSLLMLLGQVQGNYYQDNILLRFSVDGDLLGYSERIKAAKTFKLMETNEGFTLFTDKNTYVYKK